MLGFICTIWRKHAKAIEKLSHLTMTVLYTLLLIDIAKKPGINFSAAAFDSTAIFLEDIQKYPVLCALAELAFLQMQETGLIIHRSKLTLILKKYAKDGNDKELLKQILSMGLLKAIDEEEINEERKDYYFVHLTFQEFLAAYHWMKLFTSTLEAQRQLAENFLRENKFNPRHEIMWWFIGGLLGLVSKEKEQTKFVLEQYINCLMNSPYTVHEIHQICLAIRCYDEAGIPNYIRNGKQLLETFKKYTEKLIIDNYIFYDVIIHCLRLSSKTLHDICKINEMINKSFYNQTVINGLKIIKDLNVNDLLLIKKIIILLSNLTEYNDIKTLVILLSKLSINEEWFIQEIRSLLRSDDINTRMIGVIILNNRKIKDKWFIQELLSLLNVPNILTKLNFHCSVGDAIEEMLVDLGFKEEWFIALLKQRFESSDERIKSRAAVRLNRIGIKDKWFVDKLLVFHKQLEINKRHGSTNVTTMGILEELVILDKWFIETMKSWLEDQNNSVKLIAVDRLINLGVRDTVYINILRELLKDQDRVIQIKAAKLLEKLGVKEKWFIEELELLCKNSVFEIDVIKIALRLGVREKWVKETLFILLKGRGDVKLRVSNILIELGFKEEWVVQELYLLLENSEDRMKLLVIKTLAGLGVKEEWFIKIIQDLSHNAERYDKKMLIEILAKIKVKEIWFLKILFDLLLENSLEGDVVNSALNILKNIGTQIGSQILVNVWLSMPTIQEYTEVILTRLIYSMPFPSFYECYRRCQLAYKIDQEISYFFLFMFMIKLFGGMNFTNAFFDYRQNLVVAYWQNDNTLMYYEDGMQLELIVDRQFYNALMKLYNVTVCGLFKTKYVCTTAETNLEIFCKSTDETFYLIASNFCIRDAFTKEYYDNLTTQFWDKLYDILQRLSDREKTAQLLYEKMLTVTSQNDFIQILKLAKQCINVIKSEEFAGLVYEIFTLSMLNLKERIELFIEVVENLPKQSLVTRGLHAHSIYSASATSVLPRPLVEPIQNKGESSTVVYTEKTQEKESNRDNIHQKLQIKFETLKSDTKAILAKEKISRRELQELHQRWKEPGLNEYAQQTQNIEFFTERGNFYFFSGERDANQKIKKALYREALSNYEKVIQLGPFIGDIAKRKEKIESFMSKPKVDIAQMPIMFSADAPAATNSHTPLKPPGDIKPS